MFFSTFIKNNYRLFCRILQVLNLYVLCIHTDPFISSGSAREGANSKQLTSQTELGFGLSAFVIYTVYSAHKAFLRIVFCVIRPVSP